MHALWKYTQSTYSKSIASGARIMISASAFTAIARLHKSAEYTILFVIV